MTSDENLISIETKYIVTFLYDKVTWTKIEKITLKYNRKSSKKNNF